MSPVRRRVNKACVDYTQYSSSIISSSTNCSSGSNDTTVLLLLTLNVKYCKD